MTKKQITAPWKKLARPAALPAPTQEGFTSTKGAKIYYRIYRSGKRRTSVPLILLHGGMGNARNWGYQVTPFSAQFDVVVIESRGHGRSTLDGPNLTYHLMANDVLGVMDDLGIGKAAVVGWSDGAIIGLDLAIHHPDRVKRLFAFAANHNTSGLRASGARSQTFRAYSKAMAKEYAELSAHLERFPALRRQLTKMWSTMPNYSPQQLKAISVPVAVVFAEKDELIRKAHAEEQARLIPGSELIVLKGVSHFALWQDPEQFNARALEFLLSDRDLKSSQPGP
jgi:pimeloyl-ACP methyl ester carboxylesterase